MPYFIYWDHVAEHDFGNNAFATTFETFTLDAAIFKTGTVANETNKITIENHDISSGVFTTKETGI